ncbi:two-partner secretion domain-containing protein [Paraburkholderia sediminicola]|uniref:two-partner secretion domain-containing protein n=1 Tax=Paraburkholderia sediminicola TaxID=458836 RepID=UPI0038BACE93
MLNQVNSTAAAQLLGYAERAVSKAQVILANPSGIVVDGGGFISTSRGGLTTGTSTFGADGSLTGFDLRSGSITVQGAGFNATNLDQVDLLARAVHANAAIYGRTPNLITGANQVDYGAPGPTPIAGVGPAPTISIDVSHLGGMSAGKVIRAANEYGVGVSNAGVIATRAGDLRLQSNANWSSPARPPRAAILPQPAAISRTAAQPTRKARTCRQAIRSRPGSGNAPLSGSGMNLASCQSDANGNLSLNASAGDLNLSDATTNAQGTLKVNGSG